MNKLNKLFEDTLAQCVATPEIAENFATGLKDKIAQVGLATVVGVLALGSAGMAHADSTANAMIGLSGVGGILVNGAKPQNLPPECANVQGANGWVVGGATAAGAYAGNNIGGGSGKKIATVILGAAAGTMALGHEAKRIEQDCARAIAQNRQQYGSYNNTTYDNGHYNPNGGQYNGANYNDNYGANNRTYNNGQYNNGNNYGTPQYNQPPQQPTEPILYQYNDALGRSGFVTLRESPGFNGLIGNRRGAFDIMSNPNIQSAVEGTLNNLASDYQKLEQASQNYLNAANGRGNIETRYITNNSNIEYNGAVMHKQIKRSLLQFEQAFNDYSKTRGIAALNLDNAVAVDNMDVTRYRDYAQLFTPPPSAKITYHSAYRTELPNRYTTGLPK